jgi:hypothetical protein
MLMQKYVVREQDGLCQVWIGEQLVSGHPAYDQAMAIASNLADAATARGERAQVILGRSEQAQRQA